MNVHCLVVSFARLIVVDMEVGEVTGDASEEENGETGRQGESGGGMVDGGRLRGGMSQEIAGTRLATT
jgi:hypothetical protein